MGPTAVGKSRLAIELAERLGGEVVSVDSRCVYRFMDIGTAKPTPAERRGVPHHLIDLVDPDEEYSVAGFLRDAPRAIDGILRRGKRPILVGGTGYWLAALLGRPTSAEVAPNPSLRAELAGLPADELIERLRQLDPAAAEAVDALNRRRLIRAIEVVATTGRPYAEARRVAAPPPSGVRLIGLTLPRDLLYARVNARYDQMVEAGWSEEVRGLLARGYGRDLPPMRSFGYAEMVEHVLDGVPLDRALDRTKARCRRYARGQYNWFRLDDPTIEWQDPRELRPEAIG
ncbi:MAG TPA: tRNA (adenosine(37)-N6)-dimethylallyltransferase MiaA [Chloroflexota bacterium]|nr:tRNA (adenosine(37)-N6)-dimethylallyltransferase MiaA [Chloroflexota bacterium]